MLLLVLRGGGAHGRGEMILQGDLLMDLICKNDLYISSLSCLSSGLLHTYCRENTTACTDYVIIDARQAWWMNCTAINFIL